MIATAAGRPLVAADETSQGRQVVLAADLAQSSLPLTVAFPVLVANTVAWLSERTPTSLGAADISAIAEADLVNPQAATIDGASPAPVDDVHSWLAAVALAALLLAALEWTVRRQQPWTRLAAVVAMAGAIAGARVPACTSGRTVVFAIDGSGSVAASRRTTLERVRAEMQTMASGDRAGLVVFGDHGTELREPGASRTFDAVTLPPASAATNIAAGIQAAVRALPRDGDRRVVLLTDGQATMGDVRAAADDAHARIDVIPLDDRETTVIRRLEAPVEIRSGAAISLRAEISGAPGTRLSVDLLRDGATVGTRTLTLGSTGRASAIWTDTPSHAGVSFYRATAMDPRLGIVVSEAGAGVTVSGRAHVLVITDHPGDVATRLRSANTDIDERAGTAAPDTRAALASYSAVVLDAVAPHQLTARQLDAISDAVALDGAGLLMLGSRESLNASEFAASRFSDSLPIDFTKMPRPPSASMALALLIDTSGSMAATSDGVIKIAAARDAVTRALSVLPASDAVQVIGFSATPSVIVPSGDPRDPASVAERLRSMSPNGGTALAPALAQAMAWLRSTSNPVRRVLLVSDGRTTPADGDAARAAVSGQGIEVSVVAIGSDADRIWLSGLTRATGGRAYFPETLRELPRDVAREAARGAGGREVDERFRVRAGSHPLAPTSPPELGGYVAGQLRPGATAAWKSTTEDPVLAAWPFGLGRVAVFASDLRGPWSAPLASWTEGLTFWQRTVAWLARAGDASAVDAQLDTSAIGTRLIVDTGVANDDDTLPSIFATIVAPSGSTRSVPLHAVSASRAETALPLTDTGDYRATIVVADPRTGRETRFMRGWFWSGDREAQARGLNPSVLQHIADASGGTVRPAGVAPARGSGVFDEPRQRTPRSVAVALLLLAAGLLFWDYSRAHSREAHR